MSLRISLVALAAIGLLACSGDETDDGGGSNAGTDERHVRATFELTAGGTRELDALSFVLENAGLKDCEGKDSEGYGIAVAWNTDQPIAVGSYEIDGSASSGPQLAVSFPKPSGGYRISLITNGMVDVSTFGGGVVEGTFGGITLTPDDPDDAVSAIEDGAFRCTGAIP